MGGVCSPLQPLSQEPAHPVGRRLPLIATGWHNLILCCRCFTWKSGPWLREACGAEDVCQEEASAHGNVFSGGFLPADAQLAKSLPEQIKERG